jgi:hypothetical protein
MNTSKKTFAVVASATAAILVGGGVAVAYWTTTGAGTGTATAGTTSALLVTQTTSPTGLYPGGPASNLSISVNNPGSAAARIALLAATPTATDKVGCDPGDFDVVVSGISATTIAPLATQAFSNVATVALRETGANQDACKDAVVTISYSVS